MTVSLVLVLRIVSWQFLEIHFRPDTMGPTPCTRHSVGEVDYIVKTPDRCKNRQLCHVNMLNEYVDRNESGMAKPVCLELYGL